MDKFLEMLKELAIKLGTTVDNLYPLFVKQSYVVGITNILLMVFGVIVAIISWKLTIKVWKEGEGDPEYLIICLLPFIGVIAPTVVILINLQDTITAFVNPQYFAIQNILQQLSQMVGK